jgi:hypothetical protein
MANCSKCGSLLEPGDAFCASCGARMAEAPAAARSERAVPAPPPSSSFTRSRPVETQPDPVAPRRLLNPSALAWFQRRAKHERIVLAAIPILLVIIVIAVASGGGGGTTYPANVQTNFLNSCKTTGSVARCDCSLKYIEARVSLGAFQTAETAIEAGDTNYPSWVIDSATSCAGAS